MGTSFHTFYLTWEGKFFLLYHIFRFFPNFKSSIVPSLSLDSALILAEAKYWRLNDLVLKLGGEIEELDYALEVKEERKSNSSAVTNHSLMQYPPIQKYSPLTLMEIYRLIKLSPKEHQAILRWADLSHLVLAYSFKDLDLTGANLSHCDLSPTVFSNTILEHANFLGTDLTRKEFSHCDLSFAKLPQKLVGTKFIRTNLKGVDLTKLKLEEVEFTGIIIYNINFHSYSIFILKILCFN